MRGFKIGFVLLVLVALVLGSLADSAYATDRGGFGRGRGPVPRSPFSRDFRDFDDSFRGRSSRGGFGIRFDPFRGVRGVRDVRGLDSDFERGFRAGQRSRGRGF